jgi:hypothetical protein
MLGIKGIVTDNKKYRHTAVADILGPNRLRLWDGKYFDVTCNTYLHEGRLYCEVIERSMYYYDMGKTVRYPMQKTPLWRTFEISNGVLINVNKHVESINMMLSETRKVA